MGSKHPVCGPNGEAGGGQTALFQLERCGARTDNRQCRAFREKSAAADGNGSGPADNRRPWPASQVRTRFMVSTSIARL